MKAVWPVIAENGVPYIQMISVASQSTSVREKNVNKEIKFSPDRIVPYALGIILLF